MESFLLVFEGGGGGGIGRVEDAGLAREVEAIGGVGSRILGRREELPGARECEGALEVREPARESRKDRLASLSRGIACVAQSDAAAT